MLMLYFVVGAIISAYVESGDEEPFNLVQFLIIMVMWLPFLLECIVARIFCNDWDDEIDEGDFTDDTF